jgi:hypothetical protein
MTDLIKALSTALDRLAHVEAILERLGNIEHRLDLHSGILAGWENRLDRDQVSINKLETLQSELGDSLAMTDRNVNRIDGRVTALEDGANEDLEDRIGEILDRKLDHVLEDAVSEALSGREITVTL